jgi:2-polyprenyl-3-methyl-5-hydroxy-6-metoxy-1,4-benzoquinol methylase
MNRRVYLESFKNTGRTPRKWKEQDLMKIIPKGRSTVLDIGARDGYLSRLLTSYFDTVTSLNLERPSFDIARVLPVKGDITELEYQDNHFDTVSCAKVLEHIPPGLLAKACSEVTRIARFDVVIGDSV